MILKFIVINFLFFPIGNNSFECLAKTFKVKSPDGKPVFVANGKKIVINSECLKITGEEGTVFKGSIQAPTVNGDNSAEELRFALLYLATLTLLLMF